MIPSLYPWTERNLGIAESRAVILTLFVKKEQRAAQIWPLLTLCAGHRQTLTYELLGRLIGVPRQGLGHLLEPIQSFCILNRLPALTAVVVSEISGLPGEGFIAASDVPAEQATVFKWRWLEAKSPTEEQLAEASRRLPSNGKSLAELKAAMEE